MTVSTTNSTQVFAGGQSVLTFTFRNLVSNPNYIQVNVIALTGGSITTLVYNVGYTVSLNSSGVGGTVTISPTFGSNFNYIVYRQTAILQPSAYTDYNSFPANTLENNLDQLTMIGQEAETNQGLTLSLPLGTTGISATLPIPNAVSTGTLILAWNQAGTALVNVYASSASTLASSSVSQAQAGTDNTTFMTPTMTTVAIKAFAVTNVSSSTSDVTVVSNSSTPIITSVNAATAGSNVILRLDSTGKLPANLDGSQLINTPIVKIVSSSVTTAASIVINSLVAGIRYKLILNLLQNTALSTTKILFNADAGANYAWAFNGSTFNTQFSAGLDSGANYIGSGTVDSSTSFLLEAIFQTNPSLNSSVTLTGTQAYLQSGNHRTASLSGFYSGTASVTSITIAPSAGTITGSYALYQMN